MTNINFDGNISQVEMSMNATMLSGTGEVSAYETPTTSRTVVETEGSFCGSVTDDKNPQTQTGMTISEHGFASEPDAEGNVPDWELNLDGEAWDE